MKAIRRLQAVIVFVGFCSVVLWAISLRAVESSSALTSDYIQYHTAAQLLSAGRDFYDPVAMQELQTGLGRTNQTPLMYWGVPWGVALFIPLAKLSVAKGLAVWRVLSTLLILAAAWLIIDAPPQGQQAKERWLVLLLGASFIYYPTMSLLFLGQISSILAFAAALLFWALIKKREVPAGIALVLLLIKPHVMYLPAVIVLLQAAHQKQKRLLLTAALTAAILFSITEFMLPGITREWAEILLMNKFPHGVETVANWRTATFASVIRSALPHFPTWPMFAVPVSTLLLTLVWWFKSRDKETFSWATALPALSAISMFTAPYGWVFDNVVLLSLHLGTLVLLLQHNRKLGFILALALQVLISGLSAGGVFYYHHQYFWFPLLMFAVWLTTRQQLAQKPATA